MKFLSNALTTLLTLGSLARPSLAFAPTSRSAAFYTSSTSLSMAEKLPVMAPEEVMSPKAHGTSEAPVMKDLRWNCDYETSDRICNFNRHYAEYAGETRYRAILAQKYDFFLSTTCQIQC